MEEPFGVGAGIVELLCMRLGVGWRGNLRLRR